MFVLQRLESLSAGAAPDEAAFPGVGDHGELVIVARQEERELVRLVIVSMATMTRSRRVQRTDRLAMPRYTRCRPC
jgi:hypothetical protein